MFRCFTWLLNGLQFLYGSRLFSSGSTSEIGDIRDDNNDESSSLRLDERLCGQQTLEHNQEEMFSLIRKYEGCNLHAYKCPAGIWTIGYGTTIYPDGSSVKEGDECLLAEAEGLLQWYCVTKIKLPKGQWTYNQKAALYSLIYNIGQTAFDKSKCKKAIEAEDWKTAKKEWTWTKANGKELNGLVKRRNEEKELFFNGLI